MLNIMGGDWRGRRLRAPKSASVRPSAGRVKESLFSIIEAIRMKRGESSRFEGLIALDLYAGAGGLGFEFLSRGGKSVRFVESGKESLRCLRENTKALNAEKQVEIAAGAVMQSTKLWSRGGPYDLVFVDPPYDIAELNQMLSFCAEKKILAPEGILVLEHDPKREVHLPPGLKLLNDRKIGPAQLKLFVPES